MLSLADGTSGDGNDIWETDLFSRKSEADILLQYIVSVSKRRSGREDKHSYTIAVDAGYGEGKTFFLKRFSEMASEIHPVAYIDAWTDDFADDPLTALVATMKRALDPSIMNFPPVASRWNSVVEKTGRIAKLAGIGLAKKGLSYVITAAAVEGIDELIGGSSDIKEALKDKGSDVGDDAADWASDRFRDAGRKKLEEQISQFEKKRDTIIELKRCISSLLSALDAEGKPPPIIIVIDELDRCRPPYALRLLEDIKHLFDVPGLVFVLGLHSDQLSKAVNGVYGSQFDGFSYLRRFVDRTYRLATPDLAPLVGKLMQQGGIDDARLQYPLVRERSGVAVSIIASDLIARYMKAYSLNARDAFQVVDMIQTSLALTGNLPIIMGYLIPLICSRIIGGKAGQLIEVLNKTEWSLVVTSEYERQPRDAPPLQYANLVEAATKISERDLMTKINQSGDGDPIGQLVFNTTINNRTKEFPLADPRAYPILIEKICQFESGKGV